ncbi:uncharacterized protein IL334_004757 [Kwoniella shivajii]|uniref:DCG1-like protein n=1 Tax=Kwoniella shivajii TaxID=564305 RepID=A0ABZ1D1U8_9TREE|nr:hypothetical protein IL334_004757 [Kwoniella shivajii]
MSILQGKIHSTLGPSTASIRILLINPNSTQLFTEELVPVLSKSIPSNVKIDFVTAPSAAPRSIDNSEDGRLSTSVCEEYLDVHNEGGREILQSYSSVIIACFSQHPLVDSFRKAGQGVKGRKAITIGILDAGVYSALALGGKLGIATTGEQWESLFDTAIETMGITKSRYAGTKGTGFDAISLHGEGPTSALLEASVNLVGRGAAVIVLGCGGMSAMREGLENSLNEKTQSWIPVIDGVQAAVDMAIGYARMGVSPTLQS